MPEDMYPASLMKWIAEDSGMTEEALVQIRTMLDAFQEVSFQDTPAHHIDEPGFYSDGLNGQAMSVLAQVATSLSPVVPLIVKEHPEVEDKLQAAMQTSFLMGLMTGAKVGRVHGP